MAFVPGQRIGDYEIVAKLGAGGLGMVYEVQHLISQRREAMKVLLPDQGIPEMVERFRREVQTLATLNHVNIAQLHTAFYYENQLAMIMELVHGETLRDLRLRIAITLPQALDYIEQTLNALAYAHRLGVVHRDIKPSNIMITEGGFVKLLDFGIALTGHGTELTRAGFLLGSLNYISPEQVNGSKATPRSDIYAVGVTLYELLTRTLPIKGANNYEIMMAHLNQAPVPPHQVAPQVPVKISDAVMRALAKDPAQRFATAEEFLHAIDLTPASAEEGNTYAGSLPLSVRTALAAAANTPRPAPAAVPNTPPAAPRPVSPGSQSTPPPLAGPGSFSGQNRPVPTVRPASPGSQNTPHTPISTPAPSSNTPPGTQPLQTKSGSSSGLQNLNLEDISRKLAVYIGPVARIVVKKLAAQSDNLDVIYREAAKEIQSDADRAAFLKLRHH